MGEVHRTNYDPYLCTFFSFFKGLQMAAACTVQHCFNFLATQLPSEWEIRTDQYCRTEVNAVTILNLIILEFNLWTTNLKKQSNFI
jgi:hypothetical protein